MKKINLLFFVLLTISYHITIHTAFLLIMGPSGTGKSTIINHLKKRDSRFTYISPLTTRNLREGETDKVHVSLEQIEQLQAEGKLLAINCFYNTYYATPKYVIDQALAEDNFPILDWPIEKVDIMEQYYHDQLYKVYIEPENLMELANRLQNDNRDLEGLRYAAGIEEINKLNSGMYNNLIDIRIINQNNCSEKIADEIYQQFIAFENK